MRIIGCWSVLVLVPWCLADTPPAAEQGAPVVPFEEAGQHIDKECFVVGKVILTKNIGSMCFLNFHRDFRRHFTAVIKQEHFDKFPEPPETFYEGKTVKVFGRVIDYQGKPEIVVTSPDQITVLPEGAPAAPEKKPRRAATPPPTAAPPIRRAFTGTAKIATFNVLNLFDEVDDPYHADEGTSAKSKEAMEKLAKTIRAIDADVLGLQEVENRFYLDHFVKTFLSDMGYDEVVLVEGNNRRGIDVAVLSRFPVGPVTSYRHLKFEDENGHMMSFRRDLLRARIMPPGVKPFDVFVVHLKSKGGGAEATLPIRTAEARQARKVLDQLLADDPQARFVVCGDFNDTIDSKPLAALIGSGSRALVSLVDELAEEEQVSYNKAPYRSLIDFIFCSPGMGRCYQKGTYRILQGSVERSGSDHNPVVAEFDLR